MGADLTRVFLLTPHTHAAAIIEGASLGYWIVNGVLSTISQVITTVLGVAWATAAYVELRKIREGVDPESKVSVFS